MTSRSVRRRRARSAATTTATTARPARRVRRIAARAAERPARPAAPARPARGHGARHGAAAVPPAAPARPARGGTGGSAGICGSTAAPPAHYQHVVVFSFENRTWSNVGLGFSATTMPYLHSLASQCSYFSDWTETNTAQNSLTQYIGETSGVNNPNTVNDCNPSTSCRSTDDNIFRQVRVAGGTARNYVEGATTGCSASGNAAKHIPALYYFGTYTDGTGSHNDHDFCNTEVRPYSEFDVNNLPTYAFITPTLCNDGHDCGDAHRRRVGEHQHPAGSRQRRLQGGHGRGLRLVRRRSPGAEPPDRADLAQGRPHADRRRNARGAAQDDRRHARCAVHEPGAAAGRDGSAIDARDVTS